jgi:uridine kinase
MAIEKIKPILVIVCGGSGSGKTTVAELISKELPSGYTSTILSLDNFYLPKNKIMTSNFDTPEALDWFTIRETLDFLVKKRASFNIPIYDFKTRTNNKTKKVNAADVVILEGILALQDKDIREMADIKIYIDVPDDERLIRRILRDMNTRGADVLKTVKM